ncbi:iron siderophore-binding protein [Microlunatus endophyticus]|uniref:Iron siderophore-binding protein n=1 Tax=Microlunatus endophyticus TaxID=1716077 RepID=A0A917SCS0_9ACTN|nr:ABC transporter substrate-binding protein [Microlunatus endophyticus]GGL72867.1 iron siderophore-binding protein [Microlunatus endophyticus]
MTPTSLTRRGLLTSGLATATVLGLAACSGGKASSATSGKTSGDRQVQTIHGAVQVPADPHRIVPVDFPEVCTLLDLGITPVGRTTYVPSFPAYDTALKGVPKIDNGTDLQLEEIASLRPDLIIGDDWADAKQQRAPYAKLEAIAPTALFTWEQAAGNWPDLAANTAAALGRTAQLKSLQGKYNAKAAMIKSNYADVLSRTTWDLIDCSKGVWDLYSANSSHGKVLAHAGVRLGAGGTQTSGYVQYSLEQLAKLAKTDIIITNTASVPLLKKQSLFTSLPAVKAGRVYTTDLFFPASYGIASALLDVVSSICTKNQA